MIYSKYDIYHEREVLDMFFSPELLILDRNTLLYMIDEQEKEIEEKRKELALLEEDLLLLKRECQILTKKIERLNIFDMEYIILNNQLQKEDFIRLFASVGWGELPEDIVETSLANSYATFSVKCEEKVIAMARLLGDGAMSFFLKDLVVDPEYQGNGIGQDLLTHIEEYIREQLKPGWEGYLQLVSAKGKEVFYYKLGYVVHPHEHSGPGMSKRIKG